MSNPDQKPLHLQPANTIKILETLSSLPENPCSFSQKDLLNHKDQQKIELSQCVICYQGADDIENKKPQECTKCNKLICLKCFTTIKKHKPQNINNILEIPVEEMQASPSELKCPHCRQVSVFKDINPVFVGELEAIVYNHSCQDTETYPFKQFFTHVKEECEKYGKIHKCPFCQKSTKFTKKQLKAHLQENCGNMPFQCQRECELFIAKFQLQSHNCVQMLKNKIKEAENARMAQEKVSSGLQGQLEDLQAQRYQEVARSIIILTTQTRQQIQNLSE